MGVAMKNATRLLAAALVVLSAAPAAAQIIVVNPSFEIVDNRGYDTT